MQQQSTQNNDNCKDATHELWLIYCQLKDAETESETREQLISSARYRLGRVLNRFQSELKSPGSQPANLNCRDSALTHEIPNFLQGYCLIKNLTFSLPELGGNNGGKDESKVTIRAIGAGPATIRESRMERED